VNSPTPFFDIPEDEFDRIITVNLKGVVLVIPVFDRITKPPADLRLTGTSAAIPGEALANEASSAASRLMVILCFDTAWLSRMTVLQVCFSSGVMFIVFFDGWLFNHLDRKNRLQGARELFGGSPWGISPIGVF
jgi:hypothetical protein